jgi:hypothetical protein
MFRNKRPSCFDKQLNENLKALQGGDYGKIPWIFSVFYGEHAASKRAAAKALSGILPRLSFDDIVRIDMRMRQTTSMEWHFDWASLRIEHLFTPAMDKNERRAVLIFASFSPNGFLREQAVRLLGECDGTLPYVILRQNDWVAQIRQAAAEAFDKRLRNLSDGELLHAMPFAEKSKRGGRSSRQGHIDRFFNELAAPAHRDDLLKGLRGDNVRTRRMCIHALLDASRPDVEQAFNQLKHEPDPFLRKVIYEKLRHLGQDMTEASHTFLRDKYPANRILALRCLCAARESERFDIASKMLLDRNAMVRTSAQKIVRECSPEFDLRTFYAEHMERDAVAAILGLGETGRISDAGKMEGYLRDPGNAVVRAAMVSLMRLDNEKYKHEITEMLADPKIGVIKTAQALTLKYGGVNFDRVCEIFHNTPFEYTKIKCAAILFSASKWQRLIYMLEALSDGIEELAMRAIRRWLTEFNRSYVLASARQKESMLKSVRHNKDKLPPALERELLFVLK